MLVSGLIMALAFFIAFVIFGILILSLKYNLDYLTSEVSYLKEKIDCLSKKS